MELDENALELLERRMAERVETRVRGRLFAIYGVIGGGVMAALAWFGYDLVEGARSRAHDVAVETAAAEAAEAVAGAVDAAEAAALAAREAADRATMEAVTANARLRALEEWRAAGQTRLNQTLENVRETSASIDQSLEEIDTNLAEINRKLEEADNRIASLREKSDLTYLGAQYEPVIESLTEEVKRLHEQMTMLADLTGLSDPPATAGADDDPPVSGNGAVPVGPISPDVEAAARIDMIQADLKRIDMEVPPTIFMHFSPTRADVRPLVRAVEALGYNVPPWESLPAARGREEIRYFFEDDRERAERAAREINEALAARGWRAQVTARLMDEIRVKPRPNVLELWLDPRRS